MKEKIKLNWLKFRLAWHDFFMYKIPVLIDWIKDKFKNDPIITSAVTFLIFIVVPVGIFEGVQSNKYKNNVAAQQAAMKKFSKEQGIMDIVTAGPEKFLEQQLSTNAAGVQKLFNNSVKWHGKYNQVINHCKGFHRNSQYQDYLNPIVSDLQTGKTISAQKLGVDWYTKQIDITKNAGILGVMLIYINPNNINELKHAQEYQTEHRNYQICIFNAKTPSGYNLFQASWNQYLFSGEGERKGFNSSNDWIGKIYAFNNSRWVYRSKTLPKTLPKQLSDKSLNHVDEINTAKLIKEENNN